MSTTLLMADFTGYQQNIQTLRELLVQKDLQTQSLEAIDTELTELQHQKQNWLIKRKITKLTEQKATRNDRIFSIIEEISTLQSQCKNEFNTLYDRNFQNIDSLITLLNEKDDNNKQELQKLLDEKSKRDYLINSQKFFSSIDHKSFELKPGFDVFQFADSTLINDLIILLKTKIHNIETAKTSAQKEIKMRQKLNRFRTEISSIQEPETFIAASTPAGTESDKEIDNSWEDENLYNYDNTTRSGSGSFETYNELTNENDFLILFETKDNKSMDIFINRMDSLKSYYTDMIEKLSKRR